ncbi:MAG: histidine ammonia-lyase [Chitinophagales bacterium]|nr:histidine ammonia-lyase [Chitinophagales bacterium]
MSTIHTISNKVLSIDDAINVIYTKAKLKLSDESLQQIRKNRAYLEDKLKDGKAYYGINTGFGSLCDIRIPEDELQKLQHNLVVSHTCGMGEEVDDDVVRLMFLLKIQSLSYGYSGIREKTIHLLIDLFNNDVLPPVYEFGSLGASGDLAPLAHLSLPLIGIGKVKYQGELIDADVALSKLGLIPIKLESKEGLALLNGTQFMTAFGCLLVHRAQTLLRKISKVAALSIDASFSHIQPFDPLIHKIRKQKGQSVIASEIFELLQNSEISSIDRDHVQDPYSFRCIPQVHGAVHDVIQHVENVFTDELNSVTDNPNIFSEEDKILSGGNFHGQPLAMALDYLAIAIAELGSISERRTYFLLSGKRGLPNFLAANPGTNSGLMIPQYTAASIASRNKQLTMPASTDTIDSSNGQEDHVSMGANAATKCWQLIENTEKIIAIELLTAAQAMGFRKPLKTSAVLEKLCESFRKEISFSAEDRYLHEDLMKAEVFLKEKLT